MAGPDADYHNALSLIAHELRSPASIVNGYLRLLLQGDVDTLTDQQRRMLDQSGRACGRLLRLIQELSDLAALEEGHPVSARSGVPVFSLCGELMGAAGAADGAKVSPTFTCDEGDRTALVAGDASRLKRAFGALMAATARENGTDQLECHGFISHEAGSPHAVVVFGRQGLAAKRDDFVANRAAFDRWRGGTGLSLPIACRIIEAHGGSVWSPASGDPRTASLWNLPLARSMAQTS